MRRGLATLLFRNCALLVNRPASHVLAFRVDLQGHLRSNLNPGPMIIKLTLPSRFLWCVLVIYPSRKAKWLPVARAPPANKNV